MGNVRDALRWYLLLATKGSRGNLERLDLLQSVADPDPEFAAFSSADSSSVYAYRVFSSCLFLLLGSNGACLLRKST